VKDFLWEIAGDFVVKLALVALTLPSYYIVVWIFPGLEYHGGPNGRAVWFFPLIYTIGLFAAVAVTAIALFIVWAFLIEFLRVCFPRDDA
jgi:hypothetical protein